MVIRSQIDLSEVSAVHLFDATEAVLSAWADVEPVEEHRLVPLRWRMWQIDDLVLTESRFGTMKVVRTQRRFPRYDNEYLLLEIYTRGWSRAQVGDTRLRHRAGDVYMLDMSRGFQTTAGNVKTRGLLIPHKCVGYDPSVYDAVMMLPGDSFQGRVLADAVWSLVDRIEHVHDTEARRLADDVIGVVRALMLNRKTRNNGADVRNARRLAMENLVETQLADPNLGVASLCRTFGMSRATLYRHFPEAGGVAGYIRSRRLVAAFRDLQGADPTRGRIRDVSERWGFTDPGHFHRLFKRQFQINPTDAACLLAPPANSPAAPSELLEGWARAKT